MQKLFAQYDEVRFAREFHDIVMKVEGRSFAME